jgi:hypothetical protein
VICGALRPRKREGSAISSVLVGKVSAGAGGGKGFSAGVDGTVLGAATGRACRTGGGA